MSEHRVTLGVVSAALWCSSYQRGASFKSSENMYSCIVKTTLPCIFIHEIEGT